MMGLIFYEGRIVSCRKRIINWNDGTFIRKQTERLYPVRKSCLTTSGTQHLCVPDVYFTKFRNTVCKIPPFL